MNTGQCGSGRRRRSTKKSKKSRMRGGNFYGTGAAIAPGVLEYTAVPNLSANSATGQLGPADTGAMPKTGGKRHSRKHKKSLYGDVEGGKRKRRTRKMTRRFKIYGGATSVLPAKASAGFTGDGSRGLANYVDVGTGMPNNVVPLA